MPMAHLTGLVDFDLNLFVPCRKRAGAATHILDDDADVSEPALFWFGEAHSRANDTTGSVAAANLLSVAAGGAGVSAGVLFALSARFPGHQDWSLALLYDIVIPGLALAALLITTMLLVRASARAAARACQPRRRAALRRLDERFGRKSNLVAATSMLFVFSCFYRAINIADEGAATCRGAPSPFNAPAAGRFVATVGEVALVVQVAVYIEETARRLGASRGLWAAVTRRWTAVPFSTVLPVLFAESMSWSGVLSGNSRFFCAEYLLWMVIASTWAWDAAELLHKSVRWSDQVAHAGLMVGALLLFLFNAVHEIPHFIFYHREGEAAEKDFVGVWECHQHRDSPIWLKRLPFFFCYFIGCSWSSVALTYRFLRRNKVP